MSLRFARRPFLQAPSSDHSLLTPAQDAALTQLRQMLDCGITLLVGPPGTGKTVVSLKLLKEKVDAFTPIYLPDARFDAPLAFHQAILFDLGQPYEDRSANALRLLVHQQLSELASRQSPAILALDDADNLSAPVLEELRGLANVAGTRILLIAAESLYDRLAAMPMVFGRVGGCVRLEVFDEAAALDYLHRQLDAAGAVEAYTDDALQLLASQRTPRLINRAAALALLLAEDAGEECVDVEAVMESLARLLAPAELLQLARAAESGPDEAAKPLDPSDAVRSGTPKQPARKRKAA